MPSRTSKFPAGTTQKKRGFPGFLSERFSIYPSGRRAVHWSKNALAAYTRFSRCSVNMVGRREPKPNFGLALRMVVAEGMGRMGIVRFMTRNREPKCQADAFDVRRHACTVCTGNGEVARSWRTVLTDGYRPRKLCNGTKSPVGGAHRNAATNAHSGSATGRSRKLAGATRTLRKLPNEPKTEFQKWHWQSGLQKTATFWREKRTQKSQNL